MPWYTWHLWYKIYCTRFGNPFAHGSAVKVELQPLPGERPGDYHVPPGLEPSLEGGRQLARLAVLVRPAGVSPARCSLSLPVSACSACSLAACSHSMQSLHAVTPCSHSM